jgi:hypothetical protein
LYHDVDVPDFSRDAVSLSGILLTAPMGPPSAPREGLKGLLPVKPTTRRQFSGAEQASAFFRIYQGGKAAVASVPLRVRIANEQEELVMDRTTHVAPQTFDAQRTADITIALPLVRLPKGSYLLTVEAGPKADVKRQVRFEVR